MKRRVVLVIPVLAVLLFLFFPGNPEPGFRYYFRVPPGWVTEEDAEYGTVYILPSNHELPSLKPIIAGFSEASRLDLLQDEDFVGEYPVDYVDYILEGFRALDNATLLDSRTEILDNMTILITKSRKNDGSYFMYFTVYLLDDYIVALDLVCNLEDCTEYEDDIYYIIHSLRFSE